MNIKNYFTIKTVLTEVFSKQWKLQIDEKTRVIKDSFYLPAYLCSVYKLQRKSQSDRWVTKAWNYVSVLSKETDDRKIEWLLWAEEKGC